MRTIKKYVHRIEEELEDAKEYAEDYVEQKVKGNMAMANRYKEMSNDELKHAGYIHEFAVKEIDEISKEINERISQNSSTRHRIISAPKEISFVPKDNLRDTTSKSRPTNKIQEAPAQENPVKEAPVQKPVFGVGSVERQHVPSRRTHGVKDETDDKVNADMEKLDKLFNRSRDKEENAEKKSKGGLFSVFKKKR